LDDKLAEAHASLGNVMADDFDFGTAERELRRAIELNPNYPSAHQWLAELLSVLKRHDEALAEIRRALELDPFSIVFNRVYGGLLISARRFDEAIEQYRNTIELDPNVLMSHNGLGRAYEAKGMYDQAVEEYLTAFGMEGLPPEAVTKMKEVYTKSGRNAFVQAALNLNLAKSKTSDIRPFRMAGLYARLGQKDETIAWLARAYDERDPELQYLSVNFEFDGVRSDPRFVDLVRRIGLPQ
jgi:tetratricopeptide (TPR) repeat protein